MNESELLRRVLAVLPTAAPGVALGPGDDCAAIDVGDPSRLLLLAVDQVVAGVHFDPASSAAEAAGAKLLKRNLSDIAAMGGTPAYALVATAGTPADANWLVAFHAGLGREARRRRVAVIGGDLASSPPGTGFFAASLAIAGWVGRGAMAARSGASPGDAILCTGCLGASHGSGWHLDFEPRLEEGRRLAESGAAAAMMDVSDGLALDLSRMAAASGVRARLDLPRVPLRSGASLAQALADGEDYELLAAVRPGHVERLLASWPPGLAPLHAIGSFEAGEPGAVFDAATGRRLDGAGAGYEHAFAAR